MNPNVARVEFVPRIAVAIAAGVGAAFAPRGVVRGSLLVLASSLLATVAMRYSPLNHILGGAAQSQPGWRTLKTWRVEPPHPQSEW